MDLDDAGQVVLIFFREVGEAMLRRFEACPVPRPVVFMG